MKEPRPNQIQPKKPPINYSLKILGRKEMLIRVFNFSFLPAMLREALQAGQ